MKIDKLVNVIKNQKTVLAVGPMSKKYATLYPELGINGANIAPEFGVIETTTYIESFGWNG
tara:strand:- start:287 stop:469 length:183 start_codon:yes stop_codon:yes gene_type:complete